jgi:hypothetical protein
MSFFQTHKICCLNIVVLTDTYFIIIQNINIVKNPLCHRLSDFWTH